MRIRYNATSNADGWFGFAAVMIFVACVYGYIRNIVDLAVAGLDAGVTVELVLRVVGVVVAPIGVIMGLFV